MGNSDRRFHLMWNAWPSRATQDFLKFIDSTGTVMTGSFAGAGASPWPVAAAARPAHATGLKSAQSRVSPRFAAQRLPRRTLPAKIVSEPEARGLEEHDAPLQRGVYSARSGAPQ
jgi:hypothetical protein